jgi:hypothetical protein
MSNIRSASPYGTRSRNRGARVNYAEDKDNEMDYEFTTPYNHTPSNTKANGSLEGASSGTSRRQSAVAGLGKDTKDGKDVAPVVLPVSTNTAAGKKRKGGQVVAPAMTKDPSLSNMLSFDRPHLKDGKLVAEDGTALEVHGTYTIVARDSTPLWRCYLVTIAFYFLSPGLRIYRHVLICKSYRPYLSCLRASW